MLAQEDAAAPSLETASPPVMTVAPVIGVAVAVAVAAVVETLS